MTAWPRWLEACLTLQTWSSIRPAAPFLFHSVCSCFVFVSRFVLFLFLFYDLINEFHDLIHDLIHDPAPHSPSHLQCDELGDEALLALAQHAAPHLRRLSVSFLGITDAGVLALREAAPGANCRPPVG